MTTHRRLAIITETRFDAVNQGVMQALLEQAGIDPSRCFVGHVAPRPFAKLPDCAEQLTELKAALAAFQPHLCLLLDRSGIVLRVFRGEKSGIDNWRGSLFVSDFLGGENTRSLKCLATYAPDRLRMDYGLTGVVRFDLRRCLEELSIDGLDHIPQDVLEIDLPPAELVARLDAINAQPIPVSVDIEGYPDAISCIGFADGPNHAFVVPFSRQDGTSYWSEDDELALWEAAARVLQNPAVPKICHNALYELFCKAWSYGIVIENLADDTMVMWFELFAELEKSLGFVASILTKQPYYKAERKSTDDVTALRYNGKDCCRTYEIWQAMQPMLKPRQLEHYRFNMSLLVPLAYMSLRGIRYDHATAKKRLAETRQQIYELQDQINREAAKAESRGALREFYRAVDGAEAVRADEPPRARSSVDQMAERTRSVGVRTEGGQVDAIANLEPALLPHFINAFCCARRTEKREVEEVSWQPMRWNGKKWVKAGKRLTSEQIATTDPDQFVTTFEAPEDKTRTWLNRVVKIVTRTFEAPVTSFSDVERFCKDSCAEDFRAARRLVSELYRNESKPALHAQLATLLGLSVKINATNEGGDAQWYLYEHLGLPKQFQKEKGALTDRLATDAEAVIKAYLKSGTDDASRDQRALTFLRWRWLDTRTETLAADCDPDGRIRCGYNLVGTETHRLSCYESPTGSGYNLQTVTKALRDLFLADEDHDLCQRDLAGADGWTVASYAAMLGDRTMLDDYNAKLKPAQILTLMLEQGSAINAIPRADLKPLCKPISEETHWQYFAMKRVQHGSSYLMGRNTMSDQILTDSFKKDGKPIFVEPTRCQQIQRTCFFARYPGVERWHKWMEREIMQTGVLVASNGFQRRFFGRKTDKATIGAALAHLPQVYTTYATTLAISRLWNDPTNRLQDGGFIVEPLHTVHDSLLTQWRRANVDYAKAKMVEWFDNPIQIAQERIVIPASGSYGPDWKHQDNAL